MRVGRGGDRRSGQTYGENSLKYFRRCLWCGAKFPSKRPDAKTCCTAHRMALKRYVDAHGKPPLFPFGWVRSPDGSMHREEE